MIFETTRGSGIRVLRDTTYMLPVVANAITQRYALYGRSVSENPWVHPLRRRGRLRVARDDSAKQPRENATGCHFHDSISRVYRPDGASG